MLDTHAFLWFTQDAPELPESLRKVIADPGNVIRTSIVSFWEIGIKVGIGKLPLQHDLLGLEAIAASQSIEIVPITVPAIYQAQNFPFHHKDPFDRLIAATAITNGDMLLSMDTIFDAYGVARFWEPS